MIIPVILSTSSVESICDTVSRQIHIRITYLYLILIIMAEREKTKYDIDGNALNRMWTSVTPPTDSRNLLGWKLQAATEQQDDTSLESPL